MSKSRKTKALRETKEGQDDAQMKKRLMLSEKRYHTLFNSIDEGFCIIEVLFDEAGLPVDYRFLEVNTAFEHITGLVEAEGKLMKDLIPKHEEFWFEIYGRVALTGKPERFQSAAEQLNRHYDLYAFRIGDPVNRQVAVLFKDITVAKQQEADMAKTVEISEQVYKQTEESGALEVFLSQLGLYLKLDGAAFSIYENGQWKTVRYWHNKGNQPARAASIEGSLQEYLRDEGIEVLKAGKPLVADDLVNDQRVHFHSFNAHDIRSCICLPLSDKGAWRFMLNLWRSNAAKWTSCQVSLVSELANRLNVHLKRLRTEAALKHSEMRLAKELNTMSYLYDAGTRLLRSATLSATLEEALRTSISILNADQGHIHLYNPVTQTLELSNGKESLKDYFRISAETGQETERIWDAAVRLGKRIVIPDTTQEKEFSGCSAQAEQAGFRSMQSSPLYNRKGMLLGVLTTLFKDPHSFAREDLLVLDLFLRQTTDIISKIRSEEALKKSEENYSAIVNQSIAGILKINLTGNIVFTNEQFAKMLGYDSADLLNAVVSKLIYEEDLERHSQLFSRMMSNGVPYEIEKRLICKDQSVIWVNNHISPIFNSEGQTESAVVVSVDISRQKAVEKLKDDFIGVASHELKTPLTSIKAYTQLLKEFHKDSDNHLPQMLVDKLNNQVDRLTKLVYTLLDTSNVSEGILALQPEYFDLNELIENCIHEIQLISPFHHLAFSKEDLPPLYADKERIGQVLVNLISNAVKYSPAGGDVLITATNTCENKVRVSVKDQGLGIAAENQEKIFNRFFREDNPNAKHISGIGLGLFIVSEIIKNHKGTVGVHSIPGEGADFYFEIPQNVA